MCHVVALSARSLSSLTQLHAHFTPLISGSTCEKQPARADVHYSRAVRDQVIINKKPNFISSVFLLSLY